MKEQYGYTAYDYDHELVQRASKRDFVSLGFRCPEPLFQPHLLGTSMASSAGIHELIHQSLLKCDPTVREELLSGIVLSGGNTLFEGLGRRLEKELQRVLFGQHLIDAFLNDFYRSKERVQSMQSVHVMYGDVVDLIYEYEGVARYEKVCDDWAWMEVAAPSGRRYSAWIGAAEYAMEGMVRGKGPRTSVVNGRGPRWMEREQYNEHGAAIVNL